MSWNGPPEGLPALAFESEPFITSRKFDSLWATSIMPASQRARAANKLEGKPKGFGQV
jgi:hypothetical protein